jgi:ribosomal protein L27
MARMSVRANNKLWNINKIIKRQRYTRVYEAKDTPVGKKTA